ncbi:MAG: DMT family transporter [Candidatus Wenzhouxiangella sp. M2_3B_020]
MHWIYLGLAIVFEVVATSALKASEGFSRPGPAAIVLVGYLAAFVFLGLSLKTLQVGVAYAIWAALGMVLIALAGWLAFGERLDLPAVAGIGLIIAGVILIGGFSDSVGPG